MKLRLEPRELLAIGENDPADLGAVDLAVAEDAVSPAIAERGLQPFVLAIKAMDDVVARDDRSAVTREGLQSLGLAGSDAAGDRERPLHRYSVDSAPSAASASVSGSASGSASATGSSATGSSAASGSSTGAGSSTTSTSATGSSSASATTGSGSSAA